ncbi:phosphopantothenate--cysteine ligase-like [Peromyscus maniculatus bairdii]|uniref:phosphopantothenate--cysteine ligase-like n=1 Tax=Peromyscus maniculatus bairdii TaxID=230844 RepID=UPI00077D970D|nr:phosphopantothenate--cysteine ligase-like [Peromyscus maniculatus bairdii]
MLYLASAVSAFYIPVSEVPEHKIHSSGGPLMINAVVEIRILSPLAKDWVPKAFIDSLKLGTDLTIIINRARNALEVNKHQAVVSNIFESIESFVVIVTQDSETKLLLSEDEIAKGMMIEDKAVEDLRS